MRTCKMLFATAVLAVCLALSPAVMAASWVSYSGNADADCDSLDSTTRDCSPTKDAAGKIKLKKCGDGSEMVSCTCKKITTSAIIEDEEFDYANDSCKEFWAKE